MFKKISKINEAKDKIPQGFTYPIDLNLQRDLNNTLKHFNDVILKTYKAKILTLMYSNELSEPAESKYIFISDDFSEYVKSLYDLIYDNLKVQVELTVNKRNSKKIVKGNTASNIEEVSDDDMNFDARMIFYLYWNDKRTNKVHYSKVATYQTNSKVLFFISPTDSENVQNIGNAQYYTV